MQRRHICDGTYVQADWKSCTYGRAPNAIDISQSSLTCPSYTDTGPPFLYGDSDKPPHLVAFYDTLGIRRTYSRLKRPHGDVVSYTITFHEKVYCNYFFILKNIQFHAKRVNFNSFKNIYLTPLSPNYTTEDSLYPSSTYQWRNSKNQTHEICENIWAASSEKGAYGNF